MQQTTLQQMVRLLLIIALIAGLLFYAKPFFVPFTFAAILAMLFYPFCKWMEIRGFSRGFGSLLCVLTFITLVAAIISLLSWQLAGMAEEMSGIEQKLAESKDKLQLWLQHKFGVDKARQDEFLEKQKQSGGSSITTFIRTFLSAAGGFLVDAILVIICIIKC